MSIAALVTAFEARIPAARVLQLSNPKLKSATTKNATTLTTAATDADAWFPVWIGVALDTDVARHVIAAVRIMECVLESYAAATAAQSQACWDQAEKIADALALVEGRDAIPLTTNSKMSPSDEGQGVSNPYFDRKHFDGLRADNPSGGEQDDPIEGR